jgi:hypothetical protein
MRRLIFLIVLIFWTAPFAAPAADGVKGTDMPKHDHASIPARAATAPVPGGPIPTIVVAPRLEEGNRMLGATVMLNNKPLVGAKVNFFVERSFGSLNIGEDDTLDDGVAAVKFPEGLPGGATGKLHVIARINGTKSYAAASGETTVAADFAVVPDPNPFPRAIWAPHAPIPLILTLSLALAGVWSTYLFVLVQLRALRKAGKV